MKYLLILALIFCSCNVEPLCGVVVEKYRVNDKYGSVICHVVIKKDDGTYRDFPASCNDFPKLEIGKKYCW